MEKVRKYDISFSGLKLGKHSFEFQIDKKFFELFPVEQEFLDCDIHAEVELMKSSNLLTLEIKTIGTVQLICDISQKEYPQEVQNELKLVVKFSTEFNDSDDEIVTLPLGSHQLNVAQFIYESILLSIPMKHIHPDYKEQIDDEIEKYLVEELPETAFETDEIKDNPIWDKLKSINKKDLN